MTQTSSRTTIGQFDFYHPDPFTDSELLIYNVVEIFLKLCLSNKHMCLHINSCLFLTDDLFRDDLFPKVEVAGEYNLILILQVWKMFFMVYLYFCPKQHCGTKV